ncbi:MAG: FUN14 domain-containing protein [Candidatus Babeliales bacterium]
MNIAQETSKTLMDKAKSHYEAFVQKLNLADVNWKEIGSYMIIGFVAGFLAKRYLKSLLVMAIIIVVALKGLEYYHLITMNWESVRQLAGLHGVDGVQGILETTIALIRNNLTIAISSIIGFVVGYKVG